MVHTEIQTKNGKKYYYRTLSIREGDSFRKVRKYLGVELGKEELAEKVAKADLDLKINSKGSKKIKIGERTPYRQSGAGVAITIGLPFYLIANPRETEKGLTVEYKGDMVYVTPDLQFQHYFLAEDMIPIAKEIFARMEKDSNWIGKRIKEFELAVDGLEDLGEELVAAAVNFSEKDLDKTIKLY